MNKYLKILVMPAICLFYAPAALADTQMAGTVTAMRGDTVKVEFETHKAAGPKKGDTVRFWAVYPGVRAKAGSGTVIEVDASSAWVRTSDDRVGLEMQAIIYATGAPAGERHYPSAPTNRQADSDPSDSGWGDGSSRQEKPSDEIVSRIVAADKACDHQLALALADRARQQGLSNAWLNQNYATLQLLSRRSQSYQQAVNNAYLALEQDRINESVDYLKDAMTHASIPCGEDQQIISLLDLTRQMVLMDREDAIERARARAMQDGHDSDQYRARIEKKRAEREAFGNMLTGNLLGLLKQVSSGGSSSDTKKPTAQDEDIVDKLVRDTEEKNREILNKWRASQGWSTIPVPEDTQQLPTKNPGPGHSGTIQIPDDVGMSELIDKMNDDETLKRWYESQRPAKIRSAGESDDSGW
jgi:hypothetical protein